MFALQVKGINKKYEHFQLKDVSFELKKGYIMGFIGANGAGKTTTLKAILNMIHVESGIVNVFEHSFIENEIEMKQKIGYAFGGTDFYTRSRVKKVTSVIKKFYTNWNDETYKSYLEKFEINENKKIIELSAGMRVKYNLAIALSHGAKLLILDEPTSGLDPVARDSLLDIFQELVEDSEMSILFSTHITSDLEKCADYITYINEGEISNSDEKDAFIGTYLLLNGSESQLETVKNKLISFKTNSFGFTGLMFAKDYDPSIGIKSAVPNLEEIMIYYSKKENKYV